MSTCSMGYEHAEPEPVVVEEAPDLEPVAAAEVEVARIEADRDVTIAKIEHRAIDDELAVELAALRAENEQLRSQLAPPADEQQQEAVVVVAPDPEPGPEPESAPPAVEETSTPEEKPAKRKSAWWG